MESFKELEKNFQRWTRESGEEVLDRKFLLFHYKAKNETVAISSMEILKIFINMKGKETQVYHSELLSFNKKKCNKNVKKLLKLMKKARRSIKMHRIFSRIHINRCIYWGEDNFNIIYVSIDNNNIAQVFNKTDKFFITEEQGKIKLWVTEILDLDLSDCEEFMKKIHEKCIFIEKKIQDEKR